MNILTKRNGIALVAVLAILLVLTLLLPVLFSMSERATIAAMEGTDKERASYLARTNVEISVEAFRQVYYDAQDQAMSKKDGTVTKADTTDYMAQLEKFYKDGKMYSDWVLMYADNSKKANEKLKFIESKPEKPNEPGPSATEAENQKYIEELNKYNVEIAEFNSKLSDYINNNVKYEMHVKKAFDSAPKDDGVPDIGSEKNIGDRKYALIGVSNCKMYYSAEEKFYEYDKTTKKTEKISKSKFNTEQEKIKTAIKDNTAVDNKFEYFKTDDKKIEFISIAEVNGRMGKRRCIVVLPSKPTEKGWVKSTDINNSGKFEEGPQVFPDTDKATSITRLEYPTGLKKRLVISEAAMAQPVYTFSSAGNMVISTDGLRYVDHNGVEKPSTYPHGTAGLSLCINPQTPTVKPTNDPTFRYLKTANMNSWATSARQDNFIVYTASNAVEVDLPIKLLVTPCRAGRIGDGIAPNKSIYKLLVLQSPNIVFRQKVDSMFSLYQNMVLTWMNAFRMTSIVLAAPDSTPYSYYHTTYHKTVKAGKVYFMEDAYIWCIPYSSNGSNYRTQTVYEKGSDIVLYKFANRGDVYYFNAEVQPKSDIDSGTELSQNRGFSLSGYFMDTMYEDMDKGSPWWKFWEKGKEQFFKKLRGTSEPTYCKEDFKFIDNIYSGSAEELPDFDDLYVVWDS